MHATRNRPVTDNPKHSATTSMTSQPDNNSFSWRRTIGGRISWRRPDRASRCVLYGRHKCITFQPSQSREGHEFLITGTNATALQPRGPGKCEAIKAGSIFRGTEKRLALARWQLNGTDPEFHQSGRSTVWYNSRQPGGEMGEEAGSAGWRGIGGRPQCPYACHMSTARGALDPDSLGWDSAFILSQWRRHHTQSTYTEHLDRTESISGQHKPLQRY